MLVLFSGACNFQGLFGVAQPPSCLYRWEVVSNTQPRDLHADCDETRRVRPVPSIIRKVVSLGIVIPSLSTRAMEAQTVTTMGPALPTADV